MLLTYEFFRHALLGAMLAAILCSMIGTYVVCRRNVIMGGGMAHASLGGVGMGAYFGFSPLLGAAAFAVLSGLGIEWLRRHKVREDSAVALLWTLGMAVGILFAYLAPGFMTDLPAFLFGDILSINRTDLWTIGGLTVVTTLCFVLMFRPIVSICFDRNFALTQGLPVRFVETLMTILTALTIVSCLHIVGIVMVISLLSVPQLTAALFVRTFRGMILLSAVFGFAECCGGLWLSYLFNVPCGATIICVSVGIYYLCRIIKAVLSRFIK